VTARLSPTRRIGLAGLGALLVAGAIAGRSARPGEVGTTEVLNGLPDPIVDGLAVVMQLGARPAILLVAVVAAVLVDRRRARVAVAVVLAGGLAWVAATVGKEVVDRPRPQTLGADVTVHDETEDPAFPSSHVGIATASLTAAAFAARRRPAGAIAVGGVVGLGRMAAGVHLPLDVVGGLGLGVVAAVVAVELVDR
jgi:membrane-associated phospholipid phosphatase